MTRLVACNLFKWKTESYHDTFREPIFLLPSVSSTGPIESCSGIGPRDQSALCVKCLLSTTYL